MGVRGWGWGRFLDYLSKCFTFIRRLCSGVGTVKTPTGELQFQCTLPVHENNKNRQLT